MSAFGRRFANDECGATAIEYALIAGFIAVVIVAVLSQIGGNLNVIFVKVKTGFE